METILAAEDVAEAIAVAEDAVAVEEAEEAAEEVEEEEIRAQIMQLVEAVAAHNSAHKNASMVTPTKLALFKSLDKQPSTKYATSTISTHLFAGSN